MLVCAHAGPAPSPGQVAQSGSRRDSLPGAIAGRESAAQGFRVATMKDAVSAAVSCSHAQ